MCLYSFFHPDYTVAIGISPIHVVANSWSVPPIVIYAATPKEYSHSISLASCNVNSAGLSVLSFYKKFVTINLMEGFKKFILRGNVVDLAVGVVIGAAFNTVVSSFVKSFFTPIISLISGNGKLSSLYFSFSGVKINYGDFINALISFIIVAAVIYFFVVLPMNKLQQWSHSGKTLDPTTKKCPYCFSEISIKATRCAYCTAVLKEKK